MAGLVRLQSSFLRRLVPVINRRVISTSKKNRDTAAVPADPKVQKLAGKNWVSYGFDRTSEADDRSSLHSVFFVSISLGIVLLAFFLAYVPDYNLRDWAQREAFLEIRRREQAGLPLINPNLIDPAKINLPSDEELGETEIII